MARTRQISRMPTMFLLTILVACNDPAGPPDNPNPAQSLIAVAAGSGKTCALTGDHRTFCWAAGPDLVQVATPESLVTIAGTSGIFGDQFCGQGATGTVYCWGILLEVDIGYYIGQGEYDAVKIGDGYLVGSLAVGNGHACAIAVDSTAWCWGSYMAAKRGVALANTQHDLIPNQVTGSEHFARLSAGHSNTCGIRGDATVACWGDSSSIAVPTGTYLHDLDTCWDSPACSATPQLVPSVFGASQIASGALHTCVIASSGLLCWGSNFTGELGRPGLNAGIVALPVTLPVDPVSVTTGGGHTCVLSTEGAAYCWGDNQLGQFGAGYLSQSQEVTQVRFSGQFTQLAAGTGHTCGIDNRARLYCWGDDFEGSSTPWHGSVPVRIRVPDGPSS